MSYLYFGNSPVRHNSCGGHFNVESARAPFAVCDKCGYKLPLRYMRLGYMREGSGGFPGPCFPGPWLDVEPDWGRLEPVWFTGLTSEEDAARRAAIQ